MLNQVNGVEITTMSFHWEIVQGVYQILASWLWNIETPLEIKDTVQKCPVLIECTRK